MDNERPELRLKDMAITIIGISVIFLIMAFLSSGCSPRIVEKVVYRDTTIVKEIIKDSLIQVPIPLEHNQAIVNIDDTSRLETSIASSIAYITPKGLHHELANKHDATLPAIVPITTHITNTIKSTETAQIITKRVEVEKPLSWWQRLKIKAFPWLLGLSAILGLWTFRKPLLGLIKR